MCQESSSRSSGAPLAGCWENSVVECGLCGGTSGAFRKSADGQWVHAFCAEVDFTVVLLQLHQTLFYLNATYFICSMCFSGSLSQHSEEGKSILSLEWYVKCLVHEIIFCSHH